MRQEHYGIRRFTLFALISIIVFLNFKGSSGWCEEKPEFRALWVTRFEWPSEDAEKCKQNITQIFDDMEKMNFNTAVFQVRGNADVLFPSAIEPWSPLIGSKDPGFDTVAFAINEAHRRGIQFHAYVNPIPLYPASRSGSTPPPHTTPEHLFYLHGPDSPDPWVCCDEKGNLMNTAGAEYWYLSPGIPAVQAHVRAVVRELVSRYELDGLHFDRIRYPGPQYSHDPVSVRRFYGRGNPNRREWFDWQREQLDKFTNDVYAETVAKKPNIIVSCAAWGIYNRHNIPGYDKFSSGYHDYYQDTWNWISIGSMDLLMPMIYWNMADPKPNYNELVDDFVKDIGKEHLVGGQRSFRQSDENTNEILYSRKSGIQGTVIFSYGGAKRGGLMEQLKNSVYQNKVATPKLEWKETPPTGIILGTVTDEDGAPLEDAWVSLEPVTEKPPVRGERPFRRTWTSGADGRFAFLKVPSEPMKVSVEYDGAPGVIQYDVQVKAGEVKEVTIAVPGAKEARNSVFFHVFSPKDNLEISESSVNILGRTLPQNKMFVQGRRAEVFSTGAFVMDNIPLHRGKNKITISAVSPDGGTTSTRTMTIVRGERRLRTREAPGISGRAGRQRPMALATERGAGKEEISILLPQQDCALMPGDVLEVKARGPAGCKAEAICFGGRVRLPLIQTLPEEGETTPTYRGVYRIPAEFKAAPAAAILVRMKPRGGFLRASMKEKTKTTVEVWDSKKVYVGETTGDKVPITFGTHTVRLGGPYLAEVQKGTRFEIIGRAGRNYRIRLSESMTGWLSVEDVRLLPENTPLPRAFFTSFSVTGDEKYDKVFLPLNEKVVVTITPETEGGNCIYVHLFNTFFATTWISQKSGARIIGPVTGEQMEDGYLRLRIPVRSKMLWGYWAERDGNNLIIYVKRPPKFAPEPNPALKGLKIALEAGHGGRGSGAVGTMGTNEKTINYTAVKTVRKILEDLGASVVEIRPGDSNPELRERVKMAINAGADFLLSIHANAAGSVRGFLSVSGTSTYFKEKQCYPVAKMVYDELLKLGWGEFGVVGNFNYYPLRDTHFPSMLVEQAFMSNPYDEARLLDPAYQKAQAEAIVRGLEKFLETVRE